MENLLQAKGLWSLVEEGFTEPEVGVETTAAQQRSLEELKMKDHQVKHYLFRQSIGLCLNRSWIAEHPRLFESP